MARKYLPWLFLLCAVRSLEVNNLELDDGCSAGRTVTKGVMVVKEYFEGEREAVSQGVERVVLYCKPEVGFGGIQAEITHGTHGTLDKVNFTAEELRTFPDSRWYDVSVTLIYRGNFPKWGWYIRVSIKYGEELEKYIRETPISSRPTTMAIYSIGPSKWRFSRPASHCYNQSGQEQEHDSPPTYFILAIVFGVAFSMAVLISVVIACKNRVLRAAVPPQTDPGAASSRTVSTENPIYGYVRY
ncbi:uncharacterized protein LOC135200864 isoform X2 [Macrobrachium nipponense]|uniref:uncharacterized protein LOC135200864 isoform X2 n=1 Tax=Macrobrachium nipponense TaxID=159736 RepID=UPI0030C8C963